MSARYRFTQIYKMLLIRAVSGGNNRRREHFPDNARRLHRPLLLRAQTLDLGFDHPTQALRYPGVDEFQRNVKSPVTVRA